MMCIVKYGEHGSNVIILITSGYIPNIAIATLVEADTYQIISALGHVMTTFLVPVI